MYKTYTLNNNDISKIIQKFNIYTDNIYTYNILTNINTSYILPIVPSNLKNILKQTFNDQFITTNNELYTLIPLLTPINRLNYNIYNESKNQNSGTIYNTIDLHRIIIYFNIYYISNNTSRSSSSKSSSYKSSSSSVVTPSIYIPYELNNKLKLYIEKDKRRELKSIYKCFTGIVRFTPQTIICKNFISSNKGHFVLFNVGSLFFIKKMNF
jgi:hypothetical protein